MKKKSRKPITPAKEADYIPLTGGKQAVVDDESPDECTSVDPRVMLCRFRRDPRFTKEWYITALTRHVPRIQ
jgi:hypothetical protein